MGEEGFEPSMYLTSLIYSQLASAICILAHITGNKGFEPLPIVLETIMLNHYTNFLYIIKALSTGFEPATL